MTSRVFLYLACCLGIGALAASSASAQPDPGAGAAAQGQDPEPAQSEDGELAQSPGASTAEDPAAAEWRNKFEHARQQMQEGQFQAAATLFLALVPTAPTSIDRALALENAGLCQHWVQKGYALQRPGDAVKGLPLAGDDRRTSNELASLYINAVLYGIGSGIALATWTDSDDAAPVILPALLFAGGSAGLVAGLDRKLGLDYGVPQSIVTGMQLGLSEGFTWVLWQQARVNSEDEWSAEAVAGLLWGATTAGALAGGILGSRYGTTPGRASFIGTMSLWTGIVAGLSVSTIPEQDYERDDWALLAAALGVTGGAIGGVILGNEVSPSAARARFLDLGALSGGLLFGGLYLAAINDDAEGRTMLLVTSLGITSGLLAAWHFTRGMEPDMTRKRLAGQSASAWTPLVAPPAQGQGLVLGLGGTL